MFNKTSEMQPAPAEPPQPARAPVKAPGVASVISRDLKIVGNLQCAGDIQIEGAVEGDIRSKSVTVGESAHVSGSIHAESVRVSGNVQGEIEANSVSLEKTGKVTGDVIHRTLTIEAGAYLEGNCRHLPADKRAVAEAKVTGLNSPPREATAAKPATG